MRHSSIADALFPRTRQRLLAALLLDHRKSWYAAELARQLGVQRSSLQRDLLRLAAAGVIKTARSGNRTYFQPDESCPVFAELQSLLLKTAGLADFVRQKLAAFSSQIRVAAVYGSIAAGWESSASDVDLLLIGSISLMDLVPLLQSATQELRRQINPTIYTPEAFALKAQNSHFVRSVLGKPLLFIIGTRGDLEAIAGPEANRAGAGRRRGN